MLADVPAVASTKYPTVKSANRMSEQPTVNPAIQQTNLPALPEPECAADYATIVPTFGSAFVTALVIPHITALDLPLLAAVFTSFQPTVRPAHI